MEDIFYWWAYAAWFAVREMWRSMPGPWWCKLLLIVAVMAVPGQLDEIVLLAVLSALRKRRARKAKAALSI